MSPVTIFFLSMSMSVDAFAVSVGRGVALNRPRISEALRTGAVFGAVEAITPFMGWVAGVLASGWVAQVDHWLAFGLLMAVGLHMLYQAAQTPAAEDDEADGKGMILLLVTALGTSLDAMAVGLSLAFIGVGLPVIIIISISIGLASFLMATIGLTIGKLIGDRFGRMAEVLAGVVLCGIGISILVEHLAA